MLILVVMASLANGDAPEPAPAAVAPPPSLSAPQVACPEGSRVQGASPPAGERAWCVRDGVAHGPLMSWYPTGAIKTRGQLDHGKRTGDWTYYHPNGQQESAGGFEQDKPHGPWSWWYPSGERKQVGEYEHGLPHGRWSAWFESGATREDGTWEAGARDGWWTTWDEEGQILAQIKYDGGRVVRAMQPADVAPPECVERFGEQYCRDTMRPRLTIGWGLWLGPGWAYGPGYGDWYGGWGWGYGYRYPSGYRYYPSGYRYPSAQPSGSNRRVYRPSDSRRIQPVRPAPVRPSPRVQRRSR